VIYEEDVTMRVMTRGTSELLASLKRFSALF
jgi:hypothetical protein